MVRVYAGSVATGLTGGWHDTLVLRRGPFYEGDVEQLAARFNTDPEAVKSVLEALGVAVGRAGSVELNRQQLDAVRRKLTAQPKTRFTI